MEASIVDLRYKMNDVLKALERNEKVTILYRGKPKGLIIPFKKDNSQQKLKDHPFYGMNKKSKSSVEKSMMVLRGGRYDDI